MSIQNVRPLTNGKAQSAPQTVDMKPALQVGQENAMLAQIMARLEAAEARAAAAETALAQRPAQREQELYVKISSKGAISLYGTGRFPTTLYREQWFRVLAHAPRIRKTIEALGNDPSLKGHIATKGEDLPDYVDPTTGKPAPRTGAIKLLPE